MQNTSKKFKRHVEVAVDPATFAKWDVSIPPSCAAITKGGVVIANTSPNQWANVTVFTPRDQQILGDFKQHEINEQIEQFISLKTNKEKTDE